MARWETEDGQSQEEHEGFFHHKQDSGFHQNTASDTKAYQLHDPRASSRPQNAYFYSPSHDPSLQLPPIKSIEGYSSPHLQHSQDIPSSMEPNPYQTANHTSQYPPLLLPHELEAATHGQATRHNNLPVLAPAVDGMTSAEKHRKDIKRRTKTGCLTCRKRRIKCDETHPECRNCQKSKRTCLGYDSVLHQQTSPHNLQRASGTISSSRSTPSASTPETSYTPSQTTPRGYGPAAESRFTQRRGSDYHSASPAENRHDYGSAIDPALASGEDTTMANDGSSTEKNDHVETVGDALKDASLCTPRSEASQNGNPKRSLQIEDLYTIGGADPPTPEFSESISDDMLDQIEYLYKHEYAKGINQFLETEWYAHDGLAQLLADKKLCEMFAGMLELFSTTKVDDYDKLRLLPLTESRMAWLLMCMPRKSTIRDPSKGEAAVLKSTPLADSKRETVIHRLSIFEHLITGRTLSSNPLADSIPNPSSHAPSSLTQQEQRKLQFWREIGHYVTIPASNPNEIDASLGRLRLLLDITENRDVLYSMAVIRRYGPLLLPQRTRDVADEGRNKVLVAKKFVEDEAAGKGTTQVVQRVCGMAVRSWGALARA